jgi:hypothetical protein
MERQGMIALEYPKIETLYDRDVKHKVDVSKVRCPEFLLVKEWQITEKVDGTNVRVALHMDGSVEYGGRTNNAQMPVALAEYLRKTFTETAMQNALIQPNTSCPEAILFGEGYGEKIQGCGGRYRKGVSFRLFDVAIRGVDGSRWWWQGRESMERLAIGLGVEMVPSLGTLDFLPQSYGDLLLHNHVSSVSRQDGGDPYLLPEGFVARTEPLLFDRSGSRVMWKLKFRDF